MKIGDKLLCIKSRPSCNIKNNYYEIIKINYDTNEICMTEKGNEYSCYRLNILDERDHELHFCFEDHFDVLRFDRKEKLKKLKNYE